MCVRTISLSAEKHTFVTMRAHTHTHARELRVFWNVQNLEVTPSSNTPELLRSKTCTGPTGEKKAQIGTLRMLVDVLTHK